MQNAPMARRSGARSRRSAVTRVFERMPRTETPPISWASTFRGGLCGTRSTACPPSAKIAPASGWMFSSSRTFISFSGARRSGAAEGAGGGTSLFRPAAVLVVLELRGVVAGSPVVPFRERLRLPLLVLRPAERKLLHGARGRHRLEGRERLDEDVALQIGLARLAGRVPEGEVEERRAGRVDRPRDVPRARHAERRDPGGLRVPCDQSHGLVADGSNGHQQDGVDAVLEEPGGQTRGELLYDPAGGVDPAHERVETARQTTEEPLPDKTAQRVEREDDVRVRARVGQVVGEVGGAQILRVDVRRDLPERDVVLVVERHLAGGVDPPRGGQSQPASRQRFGKRRPRRGVGVDDPVVGLVAQPRVIVTDPRNVVYGCHGVLLESIVPQAVPFVPYRIRRLR